MRVHHIATVGFVGLLAVVAAATLPNSTRHRLLRVLGGSTMTAEEEAEVRQSFGVPAGMPMKDLGEVQLRAGVPKRVRLEAGKDCTITATVLTNGSVHLNLLYEFEGETAGGVKTQSHSERSESVFRPDRVPAGWRLCLFPKGQHFVVAMRPTIIQ